MKNLFLFAMSLSLCAYSYGSAEAYECKTKQGKVTFTIAQSSIINEPATHTFTYFDGHHDNRAEDPEVTSVAFGKVVSMHFKVVPDHSTTYASLIVPAMNLQNAAPVHFSTLFIITDKMTHFGGPHLVEGLLDRSTHEVVNCTGSIAH